MKTREAILDSCAVLYSHELEIARTIQESLLPKQLPSLPGFGLSGFCLSARYIGGDFYDVLPLGDDSALLVMADVMGQGVPAALFAATLRTLIRTTSEWTQSPAELLGRVNRLMFEELSGVDMFITVQLALLDAKAGRMTVASGGHCPLLLSNGRGETRTVFPDGIPLGIMPEFTFPEESLSLDRAGCALLYTDGLTEARNPEGEFFGQERLARWLGSSVYQRRPAADLSVDLVEELEAFQARVSPTDDQAFLILAGDK